MKWIYAKFVAQLETNHRQFPAFPFDILFHITYLTLILLILTGCATPAQHFETVAMDYGFIAKTVAGQAFKHQVYANHQNLQTSQERLHVYLDGDGTPRKSDPTSNNPLILSLMAQDQTPSILLGRPCYHSLNTSPTCSERLWTSQRYSKAIVDSMAAALNNWLKTYPAKKVILIGYSGGGTLAVLIANQIPTVQTVLTVAANLDVDGWSQAHGYPPLSESLNPITQKKLSSHIRQIHLAGADDDVVAASIVKSYSDQQNAQYHLFPDFDHQCCWEEVWQKILQWL